MAVVETGVTESDLRPLDAALAELLAAGETLETARAHYVEGAVDSERSRRANRILIGIERRLTRPTGPFGDGRARGLTFASDPRNGYATLALPGIATAVREKDRARTRLEVLDLANRLRSAAAEAREAARILAGGSPGTAPSGTFSHPARRADPPAEEVDAW